jgi:cytochrome c-type biogenesis protein CcmH
MNALLISLFLSASALTGAYAPQQAGSSPLEPALEARVQRLGKELRCPTCQGMSIADSPASVARAQLDKIRGLISDGKTDDEVRAYFVARYGEWILLSPKASGINWLVWLGPALLLVVGFAVIFRQIKRYPLEKSASPASAADEPVERELRPSESNATEDDYLKLVRSELKR